MKKLWAVTAREYMERVRTRWFIISTVFGPLLFGGLMYLPAYAASRGRDSQDVAQIRILDATNTGLGRAIAAELNGGVFGDSSRTQVVSLAPSAVSAAESTATRAVRRREIRGYLVLDARTMAGRSAHYSGTNATAFADMRRLESVVTGEVLAERMRAIGVPASDASQLKRMQLELKPERITASGRGGSGQVSALIAISVAMLLYVTIFIYGQNVLRGVIEEKQTRVAEIVVSSVRATTLLAGKVLGVGAVGLTQLLIWLATSIVLARFRVALLARLGVDAAPMQFPTATNGQLAILILFFVLGYTFYAALFAAIGAMVNSEQEAQQAQMPVILLLATSIVFLQSVLNSPDGTLAKNLSWIPFSSPIVMPLRMSAVSVRGWEVGVSLFALLASCYIAVYIAARIYRTGVLMYGKRPSLREVIRWVGQAR